MYLKLSKGENDFTIKYRDYSLILNYQRIVQIRLSLRNENNLRKEENK